MHALLPTKGRRSPLRFLPMVAAAAAITLLAPLLLALAGTTHLEAAAQGAPRPLAAGYQHSLVRPADGSLQSWGANDLGQLGLGDTTNRYSPTTVGSSHNWVKVSSGFSHTLAIAADGTLWAWGGNSDSQLGLGDTQYRLAPTKVGTVANWVDVSAGFYHSLALRSDGTLWAWGRNAYGQLGLNDTNGRAVPAQVGSGTNWVAMDAGGYHSAALRSDGTLWVWGRNNAGQLGLGYESTDKWAPTQVSGGSSWVSVDAGGFHTLTLRSDGTLWSCGANNVGQLGLNDQVDRWLAVQVGSGSNWVAVAAGQAHTLALRSDGSLWAWGYNFYGQLGLNDTIMRKVPTQVGSGTSWVAIAVGGYHTLALRSDGTVWSCGYNNCGQLGLGDTADRRVLTQVGSSSPPPTTPPTVSTSAATSVTAGSARLNGNLSGLGTAGTVNVSFQYGTVSGTYANETNAQARTATGTFYFDLTGLDPGTTYYFRAKAAGDGTSFGAQMTFDTQAVLPPPQDTTPPSTPAVTDDGATTTSISQLHAVWSAADAESGIAEYQYAIGTTSGGTNVVGWTSAGTNAGVTRTGLSLSVGNTYYFSVKAKNGAGLWSAAGISDGITIVATPDTTPPTTPVVTDDGASTTSTSQLHASWTSADAESGIAEYQYAVGTTSGGTDVVGWKIVGTSTQVTKTGLSLSVGSTYYFSVKAKNGAGLWSAVGVSDGIAVVATPDTTAPTTPVVTDDGATTTSTSQLHATWSAADAESGIAEYQYAVGTASGGTDVVGWTSAGTNTQVTKTGLSLSVGSTYYFGVKAKNGAGLWSAVGTSDGIAVVAPPDTTPPTTPMVTDDGASTTSAGELHAVWMAADAESGIAEYQYAIGTTSGGTDVVGWTSAGTNAGVTRTGLSLSVGSTYYFSVKAKNGAGLWSAVGTSDGIAVVAPPDTPAPVDTTPPSVPVVTDDGATTVRTNRLHASWTSSDAESGIAEYQYAIGTSAGAIDVVGWTSAGTSTQVTCGGLKLKLGTTYYFSVKAKNGVGLWSEVGSSDGIFVTARISKRNLTLLESGGTSIDGGSGTTTGADMSGDTSTGSAVSAAGILGETSIGWLAVYCAVGAACLGGALYGVRRLVKVRAR